tara:strand:- start:4816 stop:5391 length:576 start_codon:yes stop_codon:yes gene_type:complete
MKDLLPFSIAIGLVGFFAIGWAAGYTAAHHEAWSLFSDSNFRIQWELVITSFVGLYIAYRMYRIERTKAQSANAATVIACTNLERVVTQKTEFLTGPIEGVDELAVAVDLALEEARRAVGINTTAKQSSDMNRLFEILLEVKRLVSGIDKESPLTMDCFSLHRRMVRSRDELAAQIRCLPPAYVEGASSSS